MELYSMKWEGSLVFPLQYLAIKALLSPPPLDSSSGSNSDPKEIIKVKTLVNWI